MKMEELIVDVLIAAVKAAIALLGKEKTVSILQVEYDAADAALDEEQKDALAE